MRLLTRLGSFASALAVLGGCATVDSTIAVAHERPIAAPHLSAAREVSVEAVRTVPATGIDRDGVKKNGYGQDSASIFTEPKPDQIVQQALAAELGRAGFNVGKGSPNLVRVEIHQFFLEPEVGIWAGDVYAVVDATISVTLEPSKMKRRFNGIGRVTTLIWTDGSYQEAFQLALRDFLGKCVPEIVRLFEAPRAKRDAPGSM
jgi:uncharacterized lipoprotein YajG